MPCFSYRRGALRRHLLAACLLGAAQGCIAIGYGAGSDLSPEEGGGGPRTGVDPRGVGARDAGEEDAAATSDAQSGATDGSSDGQVAGPQDGSSDRPVVTNAAPKLPYDGELTSICYGASECNGDDLLCFGAFGTAPGLCTEDCDEDTDCTALDGLAPTCVDGLCLVSCAGADGEATGPCPTNMECRPLTTDALGSLLTPVVGELLSDPWCVYPEDGGSKDAARFAHCEPSHGDGDCSNDLACLAFADPEYERGYCSQRCDAAADCSLPAGVSSTPTCSEGVCELDCSKAGATCPGGMNCRDADPNPLVTTYRCLYID